MACPSNITVYINGRFLGQKLTGVQRFAREIVRHLDQHVACDPWAMSRRWVLLTPPRTPVDLPLDHIEPRVIGHGGGHAWEQTWLPYAARKGLLLGLANAGPIFHSRQLVVVHDAAVFRLPENYTRTYRVVHQTLSLSLAKRAQLATVSQFSRTELAKVLRCDEGRLEVVPNAIDHGQPVTSGRSILSRLGLVENRYFLVVGSNSRNKNIGTAVRGFLRANLAGHRLVIVGDVAAPVFGGGGNLEADGVVVAGRVSDAELNALYGSSTALIFPSIYEGFGIPPLEAMANNCPVLASDIPPVREACGTAAQYFSPLDEAALATLLRLRANDFEDRAAWQELGRERAAVFKWSRSAERLLSLIENMASAKAGG